MKYYLIAGEASGDLHASHLMHAIKERDKEAEFRFYGGDMMQAEGGTLVQHYRDLAYMGFIPVLMHLRTILKGMKHCKQDIASWQPDQLILIDYPGFNLKIAKAIHDYNNHVTNGSQQGKKITINYYISPKIWAWKEHRIKQIRRDIENLYSILPFEVDFFEKKHHYSIHYVGNPTVDEVVAFKSEHAPNLEAFCKDNGLKPHLPIIALLAGSRKQEINDNLSRMLQAAKPYTDRYQLVIAGAPSIEPSFYEQVMQQAHTDKPVILYGQTYSILQHATAALVTSGTATLETALFNVPQVVCYYMRMGWLVSRIRPYFLKIPFISLVNLVADKEVVPELVANQMNVSNVSKHLASILPGGARRENMLQGYQLMAEKLGAPGAPQHAAEMICSGKKNECE